MADPTLAEQIAWLRLEIQRREINNIRGVGDADLSMVRSILKGLEGMAAPGDTMEQAREDACIKRIGDLYMDGTIPEWAAEQLDELHRAALTAAAAEARRAAIDVLVKYRADILENEDWPGQVTHEIGVLDSAIEMVAALAAVPPGEGSPSGITE